MTILGHGMPNTDSASQQKPPEFFSQQVHEARRFFLDLNPPYTRKVVVVCGGLERTTPDYRIDRPTFPLYSIEYVVAGRGELKLGGQSHELKAGRVFSYGPGVLQQIACDRRDPVPAASSNQQA